MFSHLKKLFCYSLWSFVRSKGKLRMTRQFKLSMDSGSKITGSGIMTCGSINRSSRHSLNRGLIIIRNGGTLTILGDVYVGEGTVIVVHNGGHLSIGHGTYITGDSRIEVKSAINIGEHCAISWGVSILDDDHHELGFPKNGEAFTTLIGNKVWIGAHSMILKNSIVGDGSVVAAKSLVNSHVPSNTLCGGVPASVIRKSITWEK